MTFVVDLFHPEMIIVVDLFHPEMILVVDLFHPGMIFVVDWVLNVKNQLISEEGTLFAVSAGSYQGISYWDYPHPEWSL